MVRLNRRLLSPEAGPPPNDDPQSHEQQYRLKQVDDRGLEMPIRNEPVKEVNSYDASQPTSGWKIGIPLTLLRRHRHARQLALCPKRFKCADQTVNVFFRMYR